MLKATHGSLFTLAGSTQFVQAVIASPHGWSGQIYLENIYRHLIHSECNNLYLKTEEREKSLTILIFIINFYILM